MVSPSPSTEPRALLKRLRVATSTRALPADVADWLAEGLGRFMCGDAPSLCAALGLRGRPGRTGSAVYALALDDRNAALRLAAEALTPNQAAQPAALADAVRRFESDAWPRVRHLDAPPERFSEAQRRLWYAFKAGPPPPRSTSGIRAALRDKPPAV